MYTKGDCFRPIQQTWYTGITFILILKNISIKIVQVSKTIILSKYYVVTMSLQFIGGDSSSLVIAIEEGTRSTGGDVSSEIMYFYE